MKTENNVFNFIQTQDTAVAVALVQGIGNFALSALVSAATGRVYELIKIAHDEEKGEPTNDERNAADDLANEDDREPPVGLEARETATDRLQRYGALYADCMEHSLAMGAGEYDQSQSILSHVTWRAGLPAQDVEKVKRRTSEMSVDEALRLVSNAKQQQKFWAERKGDIIALCEDATNDRFEAALLELSGVDAVQAMVKAYGKLVDRISNRKGSPYYTSKGQIGAELRSDVGAMEAALEKTEQFVYHLEGVYSRDVLEAINAGRNLVTIDSVVEGIRTRQKDRLAKIIADIEEGEKKAAEAEKAVA